MARIKAKNDKSLRSRGRNLRLSFNMAWSSLLPLSLLLFTITTPRNHNTNVVLYFEPQNKRVRKTGIEPVLSGLQSDALTTLAIFSYEEETRTHKVFTPNGFQDRFFIQPDTLLIRNQNENRTRIYEDLQSTPKPNIGYLVIAEKRGIEPQR